MTELKDNKLKFNTEKFGEIEVDKDLIFEFVAPIIGFNDLKKYTIIDYKPESPFKWLQSLEDMSLAFPVTLCSFFGIDYQFDIPDEEADLLGIESADDVFVCNIANIPASNPKDVTINMLAPIIMNTANKKAMQTILKNKEFQVRYKLFNRENTEE